MSKNKYQIRGYDHRTKKTYLIASYSSGGKAMGHIHRKPYLHMGNLHKVGK